jgi:DNA primase
MADGDTTVQKIKDKLTIVEVVAPYVKLTKSGQHLRGLSPFTKEKTPSFFVSPDRGTYYCFSTSQGGDIFSFIEKMEGVDFRGALKILAEKAGVEITNDRGERGVDKGRTERLREAMAQATQFFTTGLTKENPAHKYAIERGLTPETIQSWSLGFAPDTWRALLEDLQGKGFTNPELVAAGLIKEADGGKGTWYDRFRNRLMFPIRDMAGRTVAFTGRALSKDDQAKYLNSPETELFKKHEVLFGMDRAKDSIRTRGFAILVEGQFDLLLLHQIGFQNTIALSGTALSSQHLALIKRYADNLMLCLDADKAGLASSARSAQAALAAGMRVKAVRLPEGKDPADLASEPGGAKEFAKRVADAQSIVEFFLSVLAATEKDQHKLILAAESTVMPLIAAVQSPLEREHFVGVTARALGLSIESARQSLERFMKQNAPLVPRNETSSRNVLSNEKAQNTANATKPSPSEVRGMHLRAVAATYSSLPLAETLISEYSRIIGAPAPSEPLPERVLFEAGLSYTEPPTESQIREIVQTFEEAHIKELWARKTTELRQAEIAQNAEEIARIEGHMRDLRDRLASFS